MTMVDPGDSALAEEIKKNLFDEINDGNMWIWAQGSATSAVTDALELLDAVFMIIIAVMMLLCFFALQGSMTANLYEQSKEIGVLRALGITRWRICMLYFYEALLLVFASCLLGLFIGTVVGTTMVM